MHVNAAGVLKKFTFLNILINNNELEEGPNEDYTQMRLIFIIYI